MSGITAIIFDFDGVIADSEPLHLRAYQDVLAPRGVTITRENYYARYLGFDDVGVFRQVSDDQGWALDEEGLAALITAKTRRFEALVGTEDVLFPGAAACVRRMAAAFPLGIASGALKHEIVAVLGRAGLDGCFRFVVASGDTPASKPAPDPYRLAARLHGVPPASCLAIEDSHQGLDSAVAAGVPCVAVTHTYPPDLLRAARRIVTSLDEITPDLVRGL